MRPNHTTRPEFITVGANAKNITGQRFGRLVALGPVDRKVRKKSSEIVWLCQCDCGNRVTILISDLTTGNTRSCGCYAKELVSKKTHGLSGHRIYWQWDAMVRRCTSPEAEDYPLYGGRGISVCDEWANSILAYIEYVSALPDYGKKGYSLDRIDNNGNYEPGNVRWATSGEQSRNTRRNNMITYDGKTQCVADWASEVGMDRDCLYGRLRLGWSVERALTEPRRIKLELEAA